MLDLNVRPALQLTQALLPTMRVARYGRIVNVTSLVSQILGVDGGASLGRLQ
jgi:3-oxoacyl-[acyl-carrier protein] reductase